MDNRVIRDIRYYETKPDGYTGEFDGICGNVYRGSAEIQWVGQRIARKLNELKFISGEFDHVYIFLTSTLNNEEIIERDFEYDKRMKCFDFGQNVDEFNHLTDNEKEWKINQITFKVLKWKFGDSELISLVEDQIEKEGRKIIINYKSKETKAYKINVGFQIAPNGNKSKIVIEYLLKKESRKMRTTVDLNHYEDIYYLVDKISVDGHQITFHPKKSIRAEFATREYKTPLTNYVKEFELID